MGLTDDGQTLYRLRLTRAPTNLFLRSCFELFGGMHPKLELLGLVQFSDSEFYAVEFGRVALHNITDQPCGSFQGDR